jgi:serine/threonine protein phosphatase PrpC
MNISDFLQSIKNIFQPIPENQPEPGSSGPPPPQTAVTAELELDPAAADDRPPSHTQLHVSVGYGLSTGKQRNHNEDAYFTLTTTFTYNENELPVGLYIIADGMGGHRNGEIASELAIRTVAEYILKEIYSPLMGRNPQPSEYSFQEVFQLAIEEANDEIIQNSYGGGTTLTAVLIVGDQMTIAHVGDSRIYQIDEEGNLEALTRDHSLVKRLQELGQITSDEAAVHPQRNVLYRALGQGEPFEPELISSPRPTSGGLLVCSDGLWSIVPQKTLTEIIQAGLPTQQTCDRLIDAANLAGGPDNISAIYIEFST